MRLIKRYWLELFWIFFLAIGLAWIAGTASVARAGVSSHGPISSGSSGANATLSNLGITSLNSALTFGAGVAGSVKTAAASGNTQSLTVRPGASSTGSGGNATFASGDGAQQGGLAQLVGGDGTGAGSVGGSVIINGGQAIGDGVGGGGGGQATVSGGDASVDAGGGDLNLNGGDASGSGSGGNVNITVGTSGSGTAGGIYITGPISTAGVKPVIASCGTGSPSIATGSTNNAGAITVGTGTPAACSITFTPTFPANHGVACVVNDDSTNIAVRPSASTTTLTITSATVFTNGDVLTYVCFGY